MALEDRLRIKIIRLHDNVLWVSFDGSSTAEIAIHDRIREHTGEFLGQAINPHLFRDAATTTLAIADPEHVGVCGAASWPQNLHDDRKDYQQATAMAAHRAYIDAVFGEDEGRSGDSTIDSQKQIQVGATGQEENEPQPERLKLSLPTREAFAASPVRDLKLNERQARALEVTIQHVAQDFDDYSARRSRVPAPEQVESAAEKNRGKAPALEGRNGPRRRGHDPLASE